MFFVAKEQTRKIHPHKFTLWIAIASMVMMFAGLTSAYIVKRSQANWFSFELPLAFWVSTVAILGSSATLYFAGQRFRAREMQQYRNLVVLTLILGGLFVLFQVIGFQQLWANGLTLQKNVSISFLYVIVGLHALHVVGGVVALLVLFAKAFSKRTRSYDVTPVEVMSTYWHFVDFLWIYLLVFLLFIR